LKTIKPFRLGILTRPYRWRGGDKLGVAVMGMASLEDTPLLMADQELWQTMAEEIDPGGVLDLGVPKATPEMLVSGHCYTAHQEEKRAAAVRVHVGGIDKTLTVFGERYWLDGRITPPAPFESMRVDWSHAYGGADVAQNPLGMGSADEIVNGLKVRRLPHVEMPGRGSVAPGQPAASAGFGALMPHWPQRMALMGTDYGDAWLQNDFPGFASDMDWAYFNAAPPDQRWAGAQEVPSGAAYEIWNMHPTQAVLAGRLPDWRARCFSSFHEDGGELCEAALRLTTVWFVPHLRRAVLIWHGSFDIAQDDAADMKHIMPALELADAPRALSHYQEVLQRRIDPRTAVHVLRDSDLVPRSVFGPWPAAQLPDRRSGPLASNMRAGALRERERRSAELQAQGLDPSLYLPAGEPHAVPTDIDDLAEFSERKKKEMAAQREKLEADDRALKARVLSDPLVAEDVREESAQAHRFDLHDALRDFRRAERRAEATGAAVDIDKERGATPLFSAPVKQGMLERMRDGHLHAAHLSAPAPAARSFRSGKMRRRLEAAPPGARHFARMNFTGIDLSGMDLRGADFTQALLEDANLEGALLDDCNFTRAVMARARLDGASMARARLDHANLGGARCTRTVLAGASLLRTNCQKTVFSGCDLSDARFEQARLHESRFEACDLSRSQWAQVVFMEMTLSNLRFDAACFKQTVWIKCTLADVSYAGATLQQCGFTASRGDQGLDFSMATLVACSFAHESSFAGAVFRGAQARQCGLRGTALPGADLSGARLEGCDFSECDLRQANLDLVVAGESLFVRTDFTGATLRGANLIDANLSKSLLPMADLSRANLFRADVSQTLVDPATRIDGAYTHHAKTRPVRRDAPQP
jgi:uncharacterized protein YjbI with pentapeptide repeats